MREVMRAIAEIADVKRRLAGSVRHGTVHSVDPKAGKVRLQLGTTGGQPFLSPWVPYAQVAGALKLHSPPAAGQQMTLLSPSGDWRQAVAMPFTWSDHNASPSDKGDEHVLTFGSFTMKLRGDELHIASGQQTVHLKPDGGIEIVGKDIAITGDTFLVTADSITLDGPVSMPKGMTAGEGSGEVARFKGGIHAEKEVVSDTEVAAPTLRGTLAPP